MEPECLEPLNLVIKKDSDNNEASVYEDNIIAEDPVKGIDDERADNNTQDNMIALQDALKHNDSVLPTDDHKILTALYMSSLMQMSNMTVPRNVTPPPFGAQPNFMQLLAMVEARHRMWQQMNWPIPPNFLRNPLSAPPPYFDGPGATSLSEQLCNSQNTPNSYSPLALPPVNHETNKQDTKQSYSSKRYF